MTELHTILIVDDSDDDLAVFQRLLSDDPVIRRIQTAGTGDDGIESYQANRPDCVLLDYNLPGRNGIEVLRKLKALDRFATIVMTTGQGDERIAAEAIKMGAADYVSKDQITSDTLLRSITRSIDSSTMQQRMAQQLEEQRLFLRILIHDASAPLRQIRTFAEQLVADARAGDYEEVLEQGVSVANAATRVQNLIDTLRAYALLDQPVIFETIAMAEVVEAAIENLADRIEEHKAVIDYHQLPSIEGHRPQLIQLIQNLISNAIKYSSSDVPTVIISAVRRDKASDSWLFEVRDNGIGIPPERLADVFQPFKRLWSQDDYEGTGLGLAICKKVVERHGGQIWCDSDGHRGTGFFFSLVSSEPDRCSTAPEASSQLDQYIRKDNSMSDSRM